DRAQDGAACRAEHDACLGVRPVDLRTAAIGSTAGEYQCRYYELVQTASCDEYSARSSCAPSTIARILPSATARGRYFMPQSGATLTSSGGTSFNARRMRSATCRGVSTRMSDRSMHPTMIFLPGSFCSTAVSSFDCAVSIDTCRTGEPASSGRKE